MFDKRKETLRVISEEHHGCGRNTIHAILPKLQIKNVTRRYKNWIYYDWAPPNTHKHQSALGFGRATFPPKRNLLVKKYFLITSSVQFERCKSVPRYKPTVIFYTSYPKQLKLKSVCVERYIINTNQLNLFSVSDK